MADEPQSNYEVFISYSSKDKKWADAACAVLERHRIRCWIAPRDLTPGIEWGAGIISGIDASKIMVVIFSTHANQSSQVRREVERAIGKGLIILPFRIEDVNPAGAMEFALSSSHWLDGFTPPLERHLDFLARSVKLLLARDRENVAEPQPPPEGTPKPPRSYGRLLIASGFAFLTVIIVAGSFAIFRGGTVPPNAESAPVRDRTVPPIAESVPAPVRGGTVPAKADAPARSDLERIQGRWHPIVALFSPRGSVTTKKQTASAPDWEFKGRNLTFYGSDNVHEGQGSFSLSEGGERKLLDYVGTNLGGKRFELLGIYAFEGEFLKICYRTRSNPDAPDLKRPDSFVVGTGTGRAYRKFRRLEDR